MGIDLQSDFILGTATAAYQIEGAVAEAGRGASIWDSFSHTLGKTLNGDTGDMACDHFHRLEEDLDIMAELGVDAYRFSIAWPRIQPTGAGTANQAGLDFYSRLVDGLLARGIQPWATLYHWDLPQTLQDKGGWPSRETAYRFGDYAEIMANSLGDRVAAWMTLNEPWCAAMLGHASGIHAPGLTSPTAAVTAAHHLLLGHGLGAQALRAGVTGRVGIALNVHQFYPGGDGDEDLEACRVADATANRLYCDPLLLGRYHQATVEALKPVTDWQFVRDGDLDLIHQQLDFVGLNYYAPSYVRAGSVRMSEPTCWVGAEMVEWLAPRPPLTQMGNSIEPRGLTDLLVDFHARYDGVDLIISENGASMPDVVNADGQVHDQDRIDYLDAHLRAVAEARQLGVPVIGYLVWSLMDNFEWACGYTQRFGLIRVDFPTQVRTWKDSARWFQQFCSTRTLP